MALTLLSVKDTHAVYEDADGDEVMLALPLPIFRTVVWWEDFDLEAAWHAAVLEHRRTVSYYGTPDLFIFVAKVRQEVVDPDAVGVVQCENCRVVLREESAVPVDSGESVCESCYEDYYPCADCGTAVHCDNTVYTLHDATVCQRCSDYNYSYCESCDGYYHHDYQEDHDHNGCDCESPAQVFSMRNDGEAPLNQDERVTIALPSGVISPEGIYSIASLVSDQAYEVSVDAPDYYSERMKWWNLARDLESALGDKWQTKEGNYTKRLSKLAHKSQGLKIPPALLSQVGCIARDNSTGVDFAIELTRNLNLPAEEFYHGDSCWWQSYSESRCSLKSNGGIGMRTFGGRYGDVQGRAWIMPLRLDEEGELQPTFDSLNPDAFIVFNGYGDLSGYVPARIVAHMAGMTYRKIGFDCSPMYVNNNSGYLVASEEIAEKYAARGALSLFADTHSNLHYRETRELVSA